MDTLETPDINLYSTDLSNNNQFPSIKATDIKNRFKSIPQKKDVSEIEKILDTAKQREEIYTEEGVRRAEENLKNKEIEVKQHTNCKRTTTRLLLSDLARFKELEHKALLENEILTYEHVFKAGLEFLESKNELQLKKAINKYKTQKID